MKSSVRVLTLALAMPFAVAAGQQQVASADRDCCKKDSAAMTTKAATDSANGAVAVWSLVPQTILQYWRPQDQRGLGMFESPKESGVPFTGFKLSWGASFRQQFQGLEHKNLSNGAPANTLIDIGRGFNLADANLNLHMQIADGIRVSLATYMSSKHHQEMWVKDGYALIDKSPIDNPILNGIMKYTTLKLGHFETNYGDQHFRRSDNGNGMFNPFVGNYVIDAFTTEVGGEVYFRNGKGLLAMAGLNSGTINGGVTAPAARTNAYVGKLGYDRQLWSDLRVRLTGSYYKNDKSPSNTLLTGDRAGSPYDLVMENTAASLTANAWSGNIRPGFSNTVRAMAINPFVKYQGFEFFGTAENFRGKALSEAGWQRDWNQFAGDLVYRFMDEKAYFGARANTANGKLTGIANKVSVDRNALAAGWYVTPVLLMKGEYMQQRYFRFPTTDIRNGGKIQGFVVEGVVSF
jgi:hypothetical protein